MNDPVPCERDALWQMVGRAMAAALTRAPGVVTDAAPGAWRVTSNVNVWMANWLACHRADPASLSVIRKGLDDAVASGRTASIVFPGSIRDQVVPLFSGRRIVSEGADAMMWRDARPISTNPRAYPGDMREVHAGADLAGIFDMVARSFEVDGADLRSAMIGALDDPAMRMFTASSDALDSVCMTWTEENITYIYAMATDPARQRRGAGWAVLAHAMEAAIRDGATGFFLEASGPGEGLYRQIGYETYEMAEFWVINPTWQQA